jgi:hypothetical protein
MGTAENLAFAISVTGHMYVRLTTMMMRVINVFKHWNKCTLLSFYMGNSAVQPQHQCSVYKVKWHTLNILFLLSWSVCSVIMNTNRNIHDTTQNHNYYDLSFHDLYRFMFFCITSCNLAGGYWHSGRTHSLKIIRLQYKFYCWQPWMAVKWIHSTDTSVTFPNAMLVYYQFKIFTERPVEILTGTFHAVTKFLQQHALHNFKLCHNYLLTHPMPFILILPFHAT